MDLHFNCSECGQSLVVDSSGGGEFLECPTCKHGIVIPKPTLRDRLSSRRKEQADERKAVIPKPTFRDWLSSRTPTFRITIGFFGCVIGIIIFAALQPTAAVGLLETASGLLGLGLVIGLYFLPSIVGRKKRNSSAIFILNLLLGWTVLGWIIALVWAATVDSG